MGNEKGELVGELGSCHLLHLLAFVRDLATPLKLEVMLFAQSGLGVEIFSPLGILILVIGVAFTVGVPVAMIKFGRKD